jgi:hypothetical protein
MNVWGCGEGQGVGRRSAAWRGRGGEKIFRKGSSATSLDYYYYYNYII